MSKKSRRCKAYKPGENIVKSARSKQVADEIHMSHKHDHGHYEIEQPAQQ
jgi:hypothetical protein